MSNISLPTALFIFYLLAGQNYLKGLYNNQMNEFIDNNLFVRHILGLMIMMVVVINLVKTENIKEVVLYTSLAYIWFVLSTKMDIHWNLLIVFILLIGYLYDSKISFHEKSALEDQSVESSDLLLIKAKNDRMRNTILISLLTVTTVGVSCYLYKKINQYHDDFDFTKFAFYPKNNLINL